MTKFMIQLTGEFDEKRTIFAESSKDLTDYTNHKELLNKIVFEDNNLNELLEDCDFEHYLNYGKVKVSKMTYDEVFINADKLEIKKSKRFCFAPDEFVSDCCGVAVIENTDLCSQCKDHCGTELEGAHYA